MSVQEVLYCQNCRRPHTEDFNWLFAQEYRFDSKVCEQVFTEKHPDLIKAITPRHKSRSLKKVLFKIGLEYPIKLEPFQSDPQTSEAFTHWQDDDRREEYPKDPVSFEAPTIDPGHQERFTDESAIDFHRSKYTQDNQGKILRRRNTSTKTCRECRSLMFSHIRQCPFCKSMMALN